MKKLFLLMLLAVMAITGKADFVTDEITADLFNVGGSAYETVEGVTLPSGNVYIGRLIKKSN